jgi:hypothetical protein
MQSQKRWEIKVNITTRKIQTKRTFSFASIAIPQDHQASPMGHCGPTGDGSDRYDLLAGGCTGLGALSPIMRTLLSSSDICMPERASNSAGTCAAILVMSPVNL